MAALKIGSSTFQPKTTSSSSNSKVNPGAPFIYFQAHQLGFVKSSSSSYLLQQKLIINQTFGKKPCTLYATSEEQQSYSDTPLEDAKVGGGKPGLISFYGHHHHLPYGEGEREREKDKVVVPLPIPVTNEKSVLWFAGPAVLVASFIFPSLYLRRILSTIFEDSLLTDFLILFFTEAVFYCGVGVFLCVIDGLSSRRGPPPPIELSSGTGTGSSPFWGHKISSVTVLVLSLIIPMVTMGFVWPWTGPAASATLAPYLVGIVVQFAFEQYATYCKSPSRPVIPIIFQVYRLHQLNRAAQLVTALSFTVRGAELTPHNLAINGSLTTILNVLQLLGVICIWSLSSFIMRLLPTVPPE